MAQIVRWIPEDENWKVLETFNSYNDADEKYDEYCNLYPNAWVEIIEPEDN